MERDRNNVTMCKILKLKMRGYKEVLYQIREDAPQIDSVLIKLNANDFTPAKGITPDLAKVYIQMLTKSGIDGIETSCGSVNFSFMNMCMGDVPVNEISQGFAWWMKPLSKIKLKTMVGKYDLLEGYNLESAKLFKPVLNKIPLILVGGLRRLSQMEKIVENNWADCISMSRPFIRDPFLVSKFEAGKVGNVSCTSCNRCLAAVVNEIPVRCYYNKFPKKRG